MIQVTRLDNSPVVVNVEMIQSIQAVPDTVITFTNDMRMIVREPVEEVSKKIIEYRRLIQNDFNVNPTVLEACSHTIN